MMKKGKPIHPGIILQEYARNAMMKLMLCRLGKCHPGIPAAPTKCPNPPLHFFKKPCLRKASKAYCEVGKKRQLCAVKGAKLYQRVKS